MPITIWAAEDVEERRRFEYYRDGLCASFSRLSPERTEPGFPFNARIRLSESGRFAFTGLSLHSHEIRRSTRDIRQAEDDQIYLNFVRRGTMAFAQGREASVLRRGDIVFVDNAREFRANVQADNLTTDLFVFRVSRTGHTTEELTRRARSHALSAALQLVLAEAASNQAGWSDEEIADAGEAVSALLRMIAADADPGSGIAAARATLREVQEVLAADLSDSRPSAVLVARELGISVRTLQAHLAMCGTSYTRIGAKLRCDAVDRLLARDAQMSVRDAMERIGIGEPATFYRAYRRERGRPPRRSRPAG